MEISTRSSHSGALIGCGYLCPYCDQETDICGASCSSMSVDRQMRMKYCLNEDFDDCPVFLAKQLSGR